MAKVYDVCAGQKDGKSEKVRWLKVGAVFEKDGRLSMKLDSIPAGEWNGWLSLFEPKPKDDAPSRTNFGQNDPDDSIPF